MKIAAVFMCALSLVVSAFAGSPPESKASAEVEKMKSLEGVWEGPGPNGSTVHLSYKVVSAGSAVMESIDHGEMHDTMITVYHLDGDKLLMTHYCSAGNQPRMRLTASTPNSLSFHEYEVTNLHSKDDLYMNKVVITWKDKDHILEEWTAHAKGKDEEPQVFTLERKH